LACLGITAVAVTGPQGAAQYLFGVIPAHAASEVHFPFQYSFTYLAAWLGAPGGAAQLAGAFCYLLLLALGLWLASRIAPGLRRRELFVFIPALCAVVGGSFLHQEELSFALPALAILSIEARGWARTVFVAALCILSIPWIAVWGAKQLFAASLFVCAVILWRLRIELRVSGPIFVAIAAALYGFELHPPQLPVPAGAALRTYAPGELVQRAWQDYTTQRATRAFGWFAIKIPVWGALIASLFAAAKMRQPNAARGTPSASTSRRI
ncbi:MAG TPA: hypothetical protein VGI19_19830, partial [Candidatus Cybelea sp.]